MTAGNESWGGRFSAGPSAIMEKMNASIAFDKRLYAQDIAGSKAHCAMLAERGVLSAADRDAILGGLAEIETEIAEGRFTFRSDREDIHMNIEGRLAELIGDAAGRLHTARSRNDQVATDFRLWLRDGIDRLDAAYHALLETLINRAEEHAATVMPGFTHLQTAQPVTFGHHLLAYVEMFGRDRGRLADCRRRLNECPLGAAALAGTPYPVDRDMTARALGFDGPTHNSMDSVASRDFALEFLSAAAIGAVHLSRLAEEIVLWMSRQFAFITLPDALTTGSSIMPQKRNPDAAELVRAKPGRISGALQGLLMVMKGLPLTYSKDMQEDKEAVFQAADDLELALAAMQAMAASLKPDAAAMRAALEAGFPTATDLADWLVSHAGLPFRQAHHVTGRLVARAEAANTGLAELPLAEMQAVEPAITEDVYNVLSVEASVAARTSFGGTAPDNVRAAALAARRRWLS